MVDGETPSKRIRLFWISIMIQNTFFFLFYSLFPESLNEFNSASLFVYEILIIALNVISFLSMMKYQKGSHNGILNEMLSEKEEIDNPTRANSFSDAQNTQEPEINSTEIVNKFLTYYEKEQNLQNSKKIMTNILKNSDDEDPIPSYVIIK